MEADGNVLDHEVYYTTQMEDAAWFRTEVYFLWDLDVTGDWDNGEWAWWNFTICFFDGTGYAQADIAYSLDFIWGSAAGGKPYGKVHLYSWTAGSRNAAFWEVGEGEAAAVNPYDMIGRCGFWRTVEDSLGIFMGDDQTFWNAHSTEVDDVAIYIPEITISDWTINVSIGYSVDLTTTGAVLYFEMPYCEYHYGWDHGGPQPQFSSWWANEKNFGGIWGGFDVESETIIDEDLYVPIGEEPNPWIDPMGWLFWHLRSFLNSLFATIGGWVWSGLIPFVGLILATAGLLGALAVENTLNLLSGILLGDATFGTSIISFLSSIISIFANVVFFMSWFITNFSFLLTLLADNLVFVANIIEIYGPLVPLLIGLHLLSLFDLHNMGPLAAALEKYARIGFAILGVFWDLTKFVVSTITSLIPLT